MRKNSKGPDRLFFDGSLFPITIFLSAFLLFLVQPLFARFILPWFGGTPQVWTTCMLFFQVFLFLGYLYAHIISRISLKRHQLAAHSFLILITAFFLNIFPDNSFLAESRVTDDPTLSILFLLLSHIGLPYFLLASTSPLLQLWVSQKQPDKTPYRLFAVSNLGSLLALFCYPGVLEPFFGAMALGNLWSYSFYLLLGLLLAVILQVKKSSSRLSSPIVDIGSDPRPTLSTRFFWFTLPAIASSMLLAVTNHLCYDIAVIPLLWILPLAIYLISFILCFGERVCYTPTVYHALFLGFVILLSQTQFLALIDSANTSLLLTISLGCLLLFISCMVCHGELVRLKPNPNQLTNFYLWISAGGAAGGIFVAVIAPLIFNSYRELKYTLVALTILLPILWYQSPKHRQSLFRSKKTLIALSFALFLLCSIQIFDVSLFRADPEKDEDSAIDNPLSSVTLEQVRNFYGVLKVIEASGNNLAANHRLLEHGRIVHGIQYLDPSNRKIPTLYYGPTSGLGIAMQKLRTKEGGNTGLTVGAVGLGVGTLASYLTQADKLRVYEINPEITRLAKKYFSFINDSKVNTTTILGDARISLEHELEQPHNFDLLVLDAFSSDAIPVHLLTQEAMTTYLRHMSANGLIATHISNRHIDLKPVIAGVAQTLSLEVVFISDTGSKELHTSKSTWAILAKNKNAIQQIASIEKPSSSETVNQLEPVFWTDDYSNLLGILRGIS